MPVFSVDMTYDIQVLIFAEKKQDVDCIHEYLLLKGVESVAIHGSKGREVFLAVVVVGVLVVVAVVVFTHCLEGRAVCCL